MERLSKQYTQRFFATSDDYAKLEKLWSEIVNSPSKKDLYLCHRLLYQAIRGKDWRKGFATKTPDGQYRPLLNQVKIDNGGFYCTGICVAMQQLKSPLLNSVLLKPFKGLITEHSLEELRKLLPEKINLILDESYQEKQVTTVAVVSEVTSIVKPTLIQNAVKLVQNVFVKGIN